MLTYHRLLVPVEWQGVVLLLEEKLLRYSHSASSQAMERRRREEEVSGYWSTPEAGGVSEGERVKPQAIFSDSEVSTYAAFFIEARATGSTVGSCLASTKH